MARKRKEKKINTKNSGLPKFAPLVARTSLGPIFVYFAKIFWKTSQVLTFLSKNIHEKETNKFSHNKITMKNWQVVKIYILNFPKDLHSCICTMEKLKLDVRFLQSLEEPNNIMLHVFCLCFQNSIWNSLTSIWGGKREIEREIDRERERERERES